MASIVQDENRQIQAFTAPKLTREEQLAAWKKRKEMLKRKSKVAKRSTSVKQRGSRPQFDRIKSLQKRLHHSGKKKSTKEKKIRRVETLKDGKDLFLKRQTPDKLTHKSFKTVSRIHDRCNRTNGNAESNTTSIRKKLVPVIKAAFNNSSRFMNVGKSTDLVKSPHRIETLQQRLSNSAKKRKEAERRRVQFINAKKIQSSRRAIVPSKLSIKQNLPNTKHDISRDHRQPLKSKKQMQKTKIENEHKECSASKTPSNVAHQKSTVSNGQDCGDKVAKQIFQGKQEQEAAQVCHASTPTQKKWSVGARSSAGQYPLFHNNSPAIQKIVNMMSPLMSPLVKTTAIKKDCQIIAEEDVPDFQFVLSIDNDELDCTKHDVTENSIDSTNGDVGNNELLARKDVAKIRNAPSSVIRMKKIKLNAKDQTNTGSKHAITPVRRSVRITSNGEEDFVSQSALLEEVDFVFQPNKHLENTYFSDSQKSKKKMFQIQTKDGSYRRGTPRPTKASSGFGVLPIYNQNKHEGVVTTPKKSDIETMPPPPSKF